MAVFTLFFVELLAMRFATFSTLSAEIEEESNSNIKMTTSSASTSVIKLTLEPEHQHSHGQSQSAAIEPHLSHVPDHQDTPDPENQGSHAESYAAQLTSLFILEFGVIFHSIFIGLTLAVSGSEFETLYVVLVFHQMFEGLGLGARLATMPWPASKRWTPYIMAQSYGLSTPIAIAIGLGVRNTYSSEGAITLVVNGIFDSVSAGILLYTGLVELMAHEFLFSHSLRDANTSTVFLAFAWMVLGAGKL